jgi:hypothetical protein
MAGGKKNKIVINKADLKKNPALIALVDLILSSNQTFLLKE